MSAGTGSGVVELTLAVFTSVVLLTVTVAVIVTVADAPGANDPSVHETAVVQVPWLGVAETSCRRRRANR